MSFEMVPAVYDWSEHAEYVKNPQAEIGMTVVTPTVVFKERSESARPRRIRKGQHGQG